MLGEKWGLLKAGNLEPRRYFEDLCAVVKGKGYILACQAVVENR